MKSSLPTHIPVLCAEALELLQKKAEKWYLDATFGEGGYTHALLAAGAHVLALDFDQEAIERGQKRFASELAAGTLILERENFTRLSEVVSRHQLSSQIAGIVFDLGTNTAQLTSQERGLSFSGNGPLDMRLDTRLGVTASDLLLVLGQKELAKIFLQYGGEPEAFSVARAIVAARQQGQTEQLKHSGALAEFISSVKRRRKSHLHPATQVFQGLRIAVNDELSNLSAALPAALSTVQPGGRIVCVSFHEGEDRIVKQQFVAWHHQGRGSIVTKKPLTASATERQRNPRSRSAKLRAFEKNL